MKGMNRVLWIFVIIACCAAYLVAEKPPRIPAWFDGEVVFFTVVNGNVEGVDNIPEHVQRPLYAFGFPPNQDQFDVIGVAPGHPRYSPWWRAILVIVLDGRDVSVDPFTSEQEILEAEAVGEVALVDTGFVFLCQVLGPNQNSR